MSTLRTMIVFAILGAVGYGVYATLNRRPPKDPPEAIPDEWANVPVVQMPGDGAPPAPAFPGMPGAFDEQTAAPASGAPGGEAPAFDAGAYPGAALAPGGDAPPADSAWSNAPPAAVFSGAPTTTPPDAAYPYPGQAPGSDAVAGAVAMPYPPVGDAGAAGGANLDAPPAAAFDSAAPAGAESAWPAAPQYAAEGSNPADGPAASGTGAPPFDPASQPPPYDPSVQAPAGAYPDAAAPAQMPAEGTSAPFAPFDGSAASGASPSATPGVDGTDAHAQFASTMTNVRHLLDQDRLADAHLELSRWHDNPNLSEVERREVHDLLDQLAGTVVYSHEPLIEPPYEVQPGETLQQIADRYQITWQLLAKINGIADPGQLRPGEKLKVVRGPFSAVVDLNQKHLTLWIEGRYAGSFPIDVGRDQVAPPGSFEVKDKVENPIYYGPDQVIGADDPANPLGERWISLGQQLGIHGSNDPQGPERADERGCIRLSDRDVSDVYDILSVGSKVVIRR